MSEVNQSLTLQLKGYQQVRDAWRNLSSDARTANADLQQQIAIVDSLTESHKRLAAASQQSGGSLQNASGGGGGGGNPSGGGSGSSVPVYRTPRRPADPAQRLINAVLSTRFSFGPNGANVQPLIGRSFSALGIGGPAAAAATALIGLAQAAINGARATAAYANSITQAQSVTGGSVRQTSLLSLLGVSSGASRSLLDRITSDPMAMGVAARFGVSATPGPYGTLNSAGVTIKILEQLRKESGEQQQRDARILGLEGFGGLLKISNAQFELAKRDAMLTGKIFGSPYGKEVQQQSTDYQQSVERLTQAGKNFGAVAFGPLVGMLKDFNNWAATFLNRSAYVNTQHMALFPQKYDRNAPTNAADAASDPSVQAQNANTDAIRKLTKSLQGSDRSDRAFPSAVKGENFHRALQMGALPTGNL